VKIYKATLLVIPVDHIHVTVEITVFIKIVVSIVLSFSLFIIYKKVYLFTYISAMF
jgi:hypothetical protein